nr:hypothetical protein [Brevundimonas naejangsanensis]
MIPDWLEPWWNWWAKFTDLFDWEAIAAIATAAAVAWALYAARSAQRTAVAEAHRRSINTMKALLIICGSGIHVVQMTLADGKKAKLTDAEAATAVLSVDNLNEIQRNLASFSPADLHSTVAIDLLMSARTGIQNLRQTIEAASRGHDVGGELSGSLAYWERLLTGIATEVVRLGGTAGANDNMIVEFWLNKVGQGH